jgi:hypothetical protein
MNTDQKEWISHRWQRETRYYEAHLKKDLFGWVVVRNWGGIGLPAGQRMSSPVMNYQDGLSKLKEIMRVRKQRKYSLC